MLWSLISQVKSFDAEDKKKVVSKYKLKAKLKFSDESMIESNEQSRAKSCVDTYALDAQRKEPSEFLRNHKGLLSFHD